MAERVFGAIPGYEIGSNFLNRKELSEAGLHRPPQAGISGSSTEGADSIVLSGGYEDDDHSDHTRHQAQQADKKTVQI